MHDGKLTHALGYGIPGCGNMYDAWLAAASCIGFGVVFSLDGVSCKYAPAGDVQKTSKETSADGF